MKREFAITGRPGYFGNNKTKISSAHATLAAARHALGRLGYTDERGERRCASCIVHRAAGFTKGETIYGDMFPQIVE